MIMIMMMMMMMVIMMLIAACRMVFFSTTKSFGQFTKNLRFFQDPQTHIWVFKTVQYVCNILGRELYPSIPPTKRSCHIGLKVSLCSFSGHFNDFEREMIY